MKCLRFIKNTIGTKKKQYVDIDEYSVQSRIFSHSETVSNRSENCHTLFEIGSDLSHTCHTLFSESIYT